MEKAVEEFKKEKTSDNAQVVSFMYSIAYKKIKLPPANINLDDQNTPSKPDIIADNDKSNKKKGD